MASKELVLKTMYQVQRQGIEGLVISGLILVELRQPLLTTTSVRLFLSQQGFLSVLIGLG